MLWQKLQPEFVRYGLFMTGIQHNSRQVQALPHMVAVEAGSAVYLACVFHVNRANQRVKHLITCQSVQLGCPGWYASSRRQRQGS